MSKTFALLIALGTVLAAFGPAHAGLTMNGLTGNGLTGNGLKPNVARNGISTDIGALQAVRLVMPDGTELVFR